MAKRKRDFKKEYERRLELAARRGETRAEARGHRAERKGQVGVSSEISPGQVPAYLDRLAERREVKVVAYLDSGRVQVIGRGHPHSLAQWMRETLAAGSLGTALKYEAEGEEIEAIRVFYS